MTGRSIHYCATADLRKVWILLLPEDRKQYGQLGKTVAAVAVAEAVWTVGKDRSSSSSSSSSSIMGSGERTAIAGTAGRALLAMFIVFCYLCAWYRGMQWVISCWPWPAAGGSCLRYVDLTARKPSLHRHNRITTSLDSLAAGQSTIPPRPPAQSG